jgi:hypothetical protein
VAALLSFSARWVRLLAKRYNEQAPDSLGDRRQSNGAAPAILTPEALSSLKERRIVLEPTGPCHRAFEAALSKKGLPLLKVNPR